MKLHKTYIRKPNGFTLIEMLIAVFILMIIASLGLFIGFDQYRSYSLSAERDTVVGLLQKARNQSMNNINEAAHGVEILSGSYVVFQGNSYATRTAAYDQILPKSLAVTTSGTSEFVFKQLRGDMSVGIGSMTISNGVKTLTVSLNSEGRINW